MDFFEAQDQARGLSRKLVVLYGAAVLALIVGVYLVAALVLGVAGPTEPGGAPMAGGTLLDPGLFAVVALGMGTMIGLGTAFRTSQLRKGGAAVAELLGGRRVDPGTSDPRERQLMNVVEEMAIASGVPVPEVFVLDREAGINAFAAGHTLNDAAVAVTRGALEAFTRDELQGVMAHEFSHILNGDMRLNVRLMGLLFGILLLTVVGRGIIRGTLGGGRSRSSSDRGGGGQIVFIGIALVVLGYLGVLAGRLIQAAISRQREYLADAAAVQFTRNPEGIANALKRIGAASHGSRIEDHHADEAGHLFFARGTRAALAGLTATHPPLPRRIRRIDPGWDGRFELPPAKPPRGRSRSTPPPGAGRRPGAALDPLFGPLGQATGGLGQGASGAAAGGMAAGGGGGLLLGGILASAGTLGPGQVQEAQRILSSLPPELRQRLRTPEGALEGVVALVLAASGGEGTARADRFRERLGNRVVSGAEALVPELSKLSAEVRLPLLELGLPSLRSLPRERGVALRDALAEAIAAGQTAAGTTPPATGSLPVDPFLFALFHLVRRNLPPGVEAEPSRLASGSAGLDRMGDEAAVLLSLLAWAGSADPAEAGAAFLRGSEVLPGAARGRALLPPEALVLDRVEGAITALEVASGGARRTFLTAAASVVQADGLVNPEEGELLRALAEALHIPLPPLRSVSPGGADG